MKEIIDKEARIKELDEQISKLEEEVEGCRTKRWLDPRTAWPILMRIAILEIERYQLYDELYEWEDHGPLSSNQPTEWKEK